MRATLDWKSFGLVSLTQLTKLLLADMRQQQYGRILNLRSTGSFVPSPLNTVYAATKAYVWSFSAALAEELAGTGITATVLCPGATRTEFQARAHIENIRLLGFGVMEAASVAEVGYRAMMAGKRVVVPGLSNKASPVGPVIAEQPDGENGESHVAARKISSVTKL